jgi:glycosyltransferase involved in cell wall biosynthesis
MTKPMPPPRVLHVFESWSPVVSGYVTRSRQIVAHQERLGVARPTVLVSSRQAMLAPPGDVAPPATLVPPSMAERAIRRLRPYAMDARHLRRAVAEAAAGADIVHAHFSSTIGAAAAAGARDAAKPFVAEVRFDLAGAMTSASRLAPAGAEPLLRAWFERHLGRADAVVAASHSLARLVQRRAGGVRVHVAANGATPVDPEPEAAAALRASYGLSGCTVVGAVSNLLAYEGFDRLIAALKGMDGLALLLVGDGPERAGLERAAGAAGIRAVFPGLRPAAEMPAHIGAIDIFCVPRRDCSVTAFASPLKLAEAMAVGSAIVASGVGDIAHMLREDHGVVVAPDDDAGLGRAIAALAAEPARRDRLRRATRARALAEMKWSDAAEVYRAVYAEVLAGAAARRPEGALPA